ncbi:hypothetical protein Sjap_014890 [Stephania japonica]|uniref:Exonuclease 1 n=1 Tax=Stephania japonica TaxID=461633 RepID=A0AAP0NQV8_9MAGN
MASLFRFRAYIQLKAGEERKSGTKEEMGIPHLLRLMKPFIEQINIKKYAGKRVGIDAYSWLHKGAYSCSLELCTDSANEKKLHYVQYFMHRINLLRHCKIIPVVVFDGGNIPCKSSTEDERGRQGCLLSVFVMKRDANLALGKEKLKEGNYGAAIVMFQRAVNITPSMAHQLIQVLRSENVEFIVAPYEADAQLAYFSSLETGGGIAAVITEDSDLLAYSCKALFGLDQIVLKMDRYGNGDEIVLDKVFKSSTFNKFTKELFTGMCVLAGCDFLPSIAGIGIKRAYSLVSKYRNLDRVLSVLKFEKGNQMPEDYVKSFKEAVAVFHHARIFDAETKCIRPLKPLPEVLLQSLDEGLDFLGPFYAFRVSGCSYLWYCISFLLFTPEVEEQKPILIERYLKESIALHRLMKPHESQQKSIDEVGSKDFPCNNPFKRRKLEDDVYLEQQQDISEQVCQVKEAEKPVEILCTTPPGSQESVTSKPTKNIVVDKAVKKTVSRLKSKKSCSNSANGNSSILSFFKPL